MKNRCETAAVTSIRFRGGTGGPVRDQRDVSAEVSAVGQEALDEEDMAHGEPSGAHRSWVLASGVGASHS